LSEESSMSVNKPRHIRDIAPLYLSRVQPSTSARLRRQLVVSARNADCVPGFHVANLAVSLSVLGYDVQLVELSGLFANSACFLALPPDVYLGYQESDVAPEVSALRGVTIHYSVESLERGRASVAGSLSEAPVNRNVMELIHLPVNSDRSKFESGLRNLGSTPLQSFLYIVNEFCDLPRVNATSKYIVPVVAGVRHNPGDGVTVVDEIGRWITALVDPVPAVIRDPASRLARNYMELGEQIINSSNSNRGFHDGRAIRARVRRNHIADAKAR